MDETQSNADAYQQIAVYRADAQRFEAWKLRTRRNTVGGFRWLMDLAEASEARDAPVGVARDGAAGE